MYRRSQRGLPSIRRTRMTRDPLSAGFSHLPQRRTRPELLAFPRVRIGVTGRGHGGVSGVPIRPQFGTQMRAQAATAGCLGRGRSPPRWCTRSSVGNVSERGDDLVVSTCSGSSARAARVTETYATSGEAPSDRGWKCPSRSAPSRSVPARLTCQAAACRTGTPFWSHSWSRTRPSPRRGKA